MSRDKPRLTGVNDCRLPSSRRVTAAADLGFRGGTVLWLLASCICSAGRGGGRREGDVRGSSRVSFVTFAGNRWATRDGGERKTPLSYLCFRSWLRDPKVGFRMGWGAERQNGRVTEFSCLGDCFPGLCRPWRRTEVPPALPFPASER